MRRNVFLFAFGALIAVACADSTTPDSTGTIDKGDASTADTGSGYDAGYGSTEDTGAPVEDTGAATDGKKETSTIADSAAKDTGSTTVGQCDTSSPAYDFKFAAILISGDPLPPECSTGCQATECCYDAGGSGMYCLPQ